MSETQSKKPGSTYAIVVGIIAVILSLAALGYSFAGPSQQLSSLQNSVNSLQSQITSLKDDIKALQSSQASTTNLQNQIASLQKQADQLSSLQNQLSDMKRQMDMIETQHKFAGIINQTPTARSFVIEWMKLQSGQDRFNPFYVMVNQGDEVEITYISNDTASHTFTLGGPYIGTEGPYLFNINGSMPGTINDLTGKTFTTQPTNNSPGVKVWGAPGNVTGTGTFTAKFAGIYRFICVYHANIGMVGYLRVLPNAAYQG